jgi:hypothetical protein
MIRLRFVYSDDPIGRGIILDTGGNYSHVEAVTPDGQYLGAHSDGGVQARPADYDKGQFTRELFVDLPADEITTVKFHHYLNACVGEPYDFKAIAGFVLHWDEHDKHKVICSALQTLALRGCGWFASPLAQPAHEISPRDLLLMLSGRVNIGA